MSNISWNEEVLNELLSTPSQALIDDMTKIEGDIMILGAGGKMGPDMCVLAARAVKAAGLKKKVYAVSRFSDADATKRLENEGVTIIAANLTADGVLENLPDCENIIFMAGRKFGTNGNEYLTWGMNAGLPTLVARRFRNSRIVAFSSGNLYPKVPTCSGGATEETAPNPVGEYPMSCLARERAFEYAAKTYGTSVCIMRLNYAIDLRYGVLHDIAQTILSGKSVDLSAMPSFNCIWQKDANEAAIRLLLHTSPDVSIVNVTGPETAGVKRTAQQLAKALGKEVTFVGEEAPTAYLNNAGKMFTLFGYPTVCLDALIQWQAEWLNCGGRSLGKPTHFEERNGNY
ncbi:MAG: NAD(P)-dependent oxidoreductase [Oscillospiraceae bacterium]|nr:NAD(P)-dependent oxidoreductase [Oscillospiraceae bacterium]